MNIQLRITNYELRILILAFSILVINFLIVAVSDAKIYIDITSPGIRKLPVSINISGPQKAKEIKEIIENDLDTTGLFSFVDPDVPGAEIRASVKVTVSAGLKAILSIQDLIEGKEVLKKRFSSSQKKIHAVAHSIANDIYRAATGKKGIFRTKLSYLVQSSAGKKELHLMDWDGNNAFTIVSRGLTSSHTWSKDGRFLIYSSERNRQWKIYILNLKQYREMTLFSAKGLNLVGGASSDDLIAFSSSKDGSPEIYTINIFGSNLKKITRSFGIDVSPVFSPDNEKIAFVSDRGGSPQIYITDINGKRSKRITFEGQYNTSPAWSPDGKRIAFVGRKNGKNQIFVVKSDGTDLIMLTHSGNNESPSFSPDGYFIAFDSDRSGKHGIYIMRINGEGQKLITPKHLNAMAPRWSPQK